MQAKDFTPTELTFGMDKDKTVAALRDLADRIERGQAIIQKVKIFGIADHQDYAYETLRITWGMLEKATAAKDKVVMLYGPGPWPVDVEMVRRDIAGQRVPVRGEHHNPGHVSSWPDEFLLGCYERALSWTPWPSEPWPTRDDVLNDLKKEIERRKLPVPEKS